MAKKSSTDLALVVLGVIAWIAAIAFATLAPTVKVDVVSPAGRLERVDTANMASAGAACGFAIAGGLCFLGAALVSQGGRRASDQEVEVPHTTETKH